MADLSKRNKANKRKGAGFEIDVHTYLAPLIPCDRLNKTGREDEGDIVVKAGDISIVLECKNEKTITLSQYVQEANTEAINYEAHRVHAADRPEQVYGAAVVKRRNSSISDSYVVMDLGEYIDLIIRLSEG